MDALVIGAGLAGVTAAWELSQSGHTVTVLDRQPEAAAETSYANAGLIATGHAMPWASPKVPGILLKSLFTADQAYRLRPRLDWHMMCWGLSFLRQCTNRRAAENTAHAYRLCRYAQSRLHQVTEQARLNYDSRRGGLLYVFRSDSALREGVKHREIIKDMGHEIRVLTVDEVVEREPAFAQSTGQIAGAVYCPTDESGDARLFSLQLAEACRKQGVRFVFDCAVDRLVVENNRVKCLSTASGERDADIYVLASGVEAPRLTRPIGIDLPIYPVKGYSVTFPVGQDHHAPSIGGVDEDRLIAFSRLGDRLRVTSTAEIAGYDVSYKPADFDHMIEVFSALMPDAADYGRPEYWSCLRPMTPNGRPFVGSSRYDNLYLNVGHGNMGWTMACGTARLLADAIDGKDAELPMQAPILR
ncbi:MAG: D-amino acid dehydrogenase [Gammaproteobacteria bacterium]|nr:D-amino acid dehydrogenase [Gammaproteobacteria bacterium]